MQNYAIINVQISAAQPPPGKHTPARHPHLLGRRHLWGQLQLPRQSFPPLLACALNAPNPIRNSGHPSPPQPTFKLELPGRTRSGRHCSVGDSFCRPNRSSFAVADDLHDHIHDGLPPKRRYSQHCRHGFSFHWAQRQAGPFLVSSLPQHSPGGSFQTGLNMRVQQS